MVLSNITWRPGIRVESDYMKNIDFESYAEWCRMTEPVVNEKSSKEIRHLLMREITDMAKKFDSGREFICYALDLREKWADLMTEEDNTAVSNMSVAIMKCFGNEFTM